MNKERHMNPDLHSSRIEKIADRCWRTNHLVACITGAAALYGLYLGGPAGQLSCAMVWVLMSIALAVLGDFLPVLTGFFRQLAENISRRHSGNPDPSSDLSDGAWFERSIKLTCLISETACLLYAICILAGSLLASNPYLAITTLQP